MTTETGMLTPRQVRGRKQAAIIAAIARALTRHSYPPLDDRLKSMVASQLRHILAGGYDPQLIEHLAVETALKYDDMRGHNRMLHLARDVRVECERARIAEHERVKREESQAVPTQPLTRTDMLAEADAMDARGEDSWLLRRALAKASRKVRCSECGTVCFTPGNGTRSICTTGADHNTLIAGSVRRVS